MSTPRHKPSMQEIAAALEESDHAPVGSRAWWRWSSATGEWTIHDHYHRDRLRREAPIAPPRRLRGNQDYESLHLGKGTKWLKSR